jgi:hypothetical protein
MFTDEFNAILEKEKLSIEQFLKDVNAYNSLDLALSELPSEYLEFYLKHEKILNKSLAKTGLLESAENPGYLGWSPSLEKKIKTVKYKGQILHLIYDPETSTWQAIPGFRSVVQALKYGKQLIDEI